MTKRRSPSSSLNPFLLWADVARQSGEMLLASAEVITRRTQRIVQVGSAPTAKDRREMQRMVAEKVDAARESSSAASVKAAQLFGTSMWQTATQMNANAALLFGVAADMARGKPSLAKTRRLVSRAAADTDRAARASAKIAKAGLAPYHRRATGNVKRLRKP